MAVFLISVSNDNSYDKIMSYIISNSLTFSKDSSMGSINIEVHGNDYHYNYFKDLIDSGRIHAHLQEML